LSTNWCVDPSVLPAEPGAYILCLDVTEPVQLPPRRFSGVLAARAYLYFGSARGPGGIRARCARHFRRSKNSHWHVDWLTGPATRIHAAPFPGSDECDLMARALAVGGAALAIAVAGFGSTDCRRCATHLVAVTGALPNDFLDALYQ